MGKEPTYTITIQAGCSIALATCRIEDELQLEVPVAEWDAMDDDARQAWVYREVGEWANDHFDYWGEVTEVVTKGGAADA